MSKVPEITLIFWIMKIAATTLGETAGDAIHVNELGLSCRHSDLRSDFFRDSGCANPGNAIHVFFVLDNDHRHNHSWDDSKRISPTVLSKPITLPTAASKARAVTLHILGIGEHT